MLNSISGEPRPLFVPVGTNPARLFGLDAETRARRLATEARLEPAAEADPARAAILADLSYAWDPAWLAAIAARPGSILTLGGRPVLAHLPEAYRTETIVDAMNAKSAWAGNDLEVLEGETAQLSYHKLRKRDRPFVMLLDAADPEPVERAAYNAAYKGVTDALTLYLWRRPAFYLTRWAANAGMTPNMVTAIGAFFCLLTIYLFWIGQYWPGIAAAFTFMVLDTVDGKLARCTGTSSNWGNIFDHGIDLVHPPFWWWAWAEGLHDYGTPIEPVLSTMLLAAIIFGYVAQRLIEAIFVRRFGMHIHVWRKLDSKFRLITARRNPNMVILVVSLIFRRPDVGLELVALWTLISLIFHAVRLAQANVRRDRGLPVASWLA
ncbi:MAG TPA: CDP-alcohol phosphatidyltransferase family protein [Sphingomicrobium sp.]|nr:CDP-alcohol phosphatidyltransferase family protein [Sphingomicrobium sp.]